MLYVNYRGIIIVTLCINFCLYCIFHSSQHCTIIFYCYYVCVVFYTENLIKFCVVLMAWLSIEINAHRDQSINFEHNKNVTVYVVRLIIEQSSYVTRHEKIGLMCI